MRLAVVGGGVAGLGTALHALRRVDWAGAVPEVRVFESAARPGGWIQTSVYEDADDGSEYVFENGPRSIRPRGPAGMRTLRTLSELDLLGSVVTPDKQASKRFLWTQDAGVFALPSSLASATRSPALKGVLRDLVREATIPAAAANQQDESVHDFITRRFGEKVALSLADPLVSGVFAGDARRLSIDAAFPFLPQYEREFGSVTKGMLLTRSSDEENALRSALDETAVDMLVRPRVSMFTLANGLSTLTDAMAGALGAQVVQTQRPVTHLEPTAGPGASRVTVSTADGVSQDFDAVISAVPSSVLADLLPPGFASTIGTGGHQPAWDQVTALRYTTLATVCLGFSTDVIPEQLRGFGYLIARQEGSPVLGVIFDSAAFPDLNDHASQTRLSVMLGGEHRDPGVFDAMSDGALADLAMREVAAHTGIDMSQVKLARVHWARRSIPQYPLAHRAAVANVRASLNQAGIPLFLAGAAYDGVSVNDCLASGERAAEAAALALTQQASR